MFGVAVERINNLENAPTASGPTPTVAPQNQSQFLRLLDLLERKRAAGIVQSRIDPVTNDLLIQFNNQAVEAEVEELKDLLNLDPELSSFKVDGEVVQPRPDTLSIRSRSIMSILFYLSQNIDVPSADQEKGYACDIQISIPKHLTNPHRGYFILYTFYAPSRIYPRTCNV